MTPSASSGGPAQGSAADVLARALLDPSVCPSCGAALSGPRCARCGVDLSGEAGRRVWTLGQRAVLTLREREQLLAGLREEAAARRPVPAPPDVSPEPTDVQPPPPSPSGALPSPAAPRGPAVQSLLVGLGALLLAVAAVVFLAVAWDLLGLAGRATVVALLTVTALGAAAVLRPRLPETAEALGALGAVLVVGDAWAARATGLGGLDAVPGLAYAAVVAGTVAVLLGVFGVVTRLRSATVTAAVLAPATPVLIGLHLADPLSGVESWVVPVVAGLLGGGLVAAGRGLLPVRLRAEARVGRVAAVVCTALAAVLLRLGGLSAGITATALIGVVVLALQAVADAAHLDAAHLDARPLAQPPADAPSPPSTSVRRWCSAWSSAAGAGLVLTAVLGALTSLHGGNWPETSGAGEWARAAASGIAAALAAVAVLAAARWVPGSAASSGLPDAVRHGLRPASAAVGAALALAVTVLPLAAGALHVLATLVRASSPPWRAVPGTTVGELLSGSAQVDGSLRFDGPGSTAEQVALAAGLLVPGLLLVLTGAGRRRGRTGAVVDLARRGGGVALVTGVVLLGMLPSLRMATATALLTLAAVGAGGLAARWHPAAFSLACAGFATVAVLLAWSSQATSGPVTALGVLGLLGARRAVRRPEARAALTGAAGLAGGFAVAALTAPLLSATGPWADLPPAAAAGLAAVLATACALAGVVALAVPAGRVPDWQRAERLVAAATGALAGVFALAVTLSAARFTETAVVIAGLLVLAGLLALAGSAGVRVPAGVRRAAAGAVPVLAAGLAASVTAAADGGVRGVALASVLAAVAVAAALVVLALRVPAWPGNARRLPAEVGAVVAAAGGLVLGGTLPGGWLLFALTGAGLAAVAVTPGRSRLADASIVPLSVASALLLAQAGVHLPEAYTVPPAVALLALGGYRLRAGHQVSSWPALGPGLVLGLAPSVVVAADGGPLVRVVVLAVAAGGVVLAGARGRLGAPVAVGAGALAAHTVVQLGPWLVELGTSVPRWTVLATVGALLLLEGATYERQVTRLRAAAVRLASLR